MSQKRRLPLIAAFVTSLCAAPGCGPATFQQTGKPTRTIEFRRASLDPVAEWEEFIQANGEKLYISPTAEVTSADVAGTRMEPDPEGPPAIRMNFDDAGALKLKQLTSDLLFVPERQERLRLAVLIDGKLHSAPKVTEPLDSGYGVISLYKWSDSDALALAKGVVGH